MTEINKAREEMRKLIDVGKLHASTGPEVYGDWSDEDKAGFQQALAKIFNWKEQSDDSVTEK